MGEEMGVLVDCGCSERAAAVERATGIPQNVQHAAVALVAGIVLLLALRALGSKRKGK